VGEGKDHVNAGRDRVWFADFSEFEDNYSHGVFSPSYTLTEGITDMTNSDCARHKHYVEIWSKAVDTQMHFNEMSVKSRQLGLAFVAAALGLSVVLVSRDEDFSFAICNVQLHVSVLLLLAAMLALLAVRLLDLDVYHQMLRGAVAFGEDFEKNYMKEIFSLEKGMTQAITHFSRHDDAGKKTSNDGKYTYSGKNEVSAKDKIQRFYNYTICALAASAIALFLVTNFGHKMDKRPAPAPAAQSGADALSHPAVAVAAPVQHGPTPFETAPVGPKEKMPPVGQSDESKR
jgi:hypothetical protein